MSDCNLEKEIDAVGREKVFQRAREYGWHSDPPPKWVWWGIVAELRAPEPSVRALHLS